VLVNNAGILEKDDKSVPTVSAGTVLWTFTTNTLGPLLVTQALLPLLLKSHGPRVINVSSGVAALHDLPKPHRRLVHLVTLSPEPAPELLAIIGGDTKNEHIRPRIRIRPLIGACFAPRL